MDVLQLGVCVLKEGRSTVEGASPRGAWSRRESWAAGCPGAAAPSWTSRRRPSPPRAASGTPPSGSGSSLVAKKQTNKQTKTETPNQRQ